MAMDSVLAALLTPTGSLFLIAAGLGCYYVWRSSKLRGMPPGPRSFPVIGSLLSLRGSDVREDLCRLARQYGDVFTMDMGANRTVMLASYSAIKEALVTKTAQELSGRPQDIFVFTEVTEGKGIVGTQGPLWREQRKFVHGVFREFGVGRPVFEEKIQEEISYLLQVLRDNASKPYNPAAIIQKSVANVINNVIFGRRYEYQDPQFLRQMHILEENMRIMGGSGALTMFPFLKYLPGDYFQYKKLKADAKRLVSDFLGRIKEHRENRTPGVVSDLIDAYLEEAERQKDWEDTTFTDDQLIYVCGDLFGAGTETTTTTLRWAILFMLHNPEMLRRVQREVAENVGPSRMPTMKDKPYLPYTEAVLLETQRKGDVFPFGVPHACMEDMTLRGYHIPKGTHFMTVLYAAHRDPKVWKEPYRFNPERFLDAEGHISKDEHLIPFSMGRRVCLGESLARMELFLFFVALMQHFNFRLPPGASLPSLDGILGLTYAPPSFDVIMELKR